MNAENTYFIIETYFLFVCLQFMQQTASIFHPKSETLARKSERQKRNMRWNLILPARSAMKDLLKFL